MRTATIKRLKLLSLPQKCKDEVYKSRWKYNYCYKVWRKGKPIYEIAKYSKPHKKAKNYTNILKKPITLREIVHLYCNYAHLFGFTRENLYFNEEFAYFVALIHYEKELNNVILENIDPNFVFGAIYKTPNTKNVYRLIRHLRELVDIKDRYNNGDKKLLPYICGKEKSIKNCLNKWFSELELIDGISPEERHKNILKL